MIIRENYGEEHIRELQTKSRRNPQLIERALYALGLLEATNPVCSQAKALCELSYRCRKAP